MRFATLIATLAGAPMLATAGPYDNWAPHRYCNDLDGIEATRIPPLTAQQAELVESLEQVQVIARHGARAPYSRLFCWDSHQHNPMNAKWDCTTTSVSSQDINPEETSRGFGRLYRKAYMDGHNILKGNCVVGGLLHTGRQQHKKNGLFLRDAYVGDGSLKLFPTANLSHLEQKEIYLRSDDQERTLGSGQALIDGLFPDDGAISPELHRMLSWDVADISVDYINANERICPMMGHIGELANDSPEFWAHLRDPATVEIEHHFQDLVGNFSWGSALECLSTARCNDLELPEGVDEETFTKTYHEVEVRQAIYLTHNDSWYSKLAMQPLAHDMITRIDEALNGGPDVYKLSVTMAHDSTLMPFIAAVAKENWDRTWTPYAGMLAIELYKTKAGSYAVRMVFHGQPLLLPDCHDTLCDIEDFLRAYSFARAARTTHDCKVPKKKESKSHPSSLMTAVADNGVGFHASHYLGSFMLLGLVVVAVLLGLRAKNRRNQQRRTPELFTSSVGPLTPPEKPKDDECCHLDCPNCVLLVYQEKLLEYELSLQNQNTAQKPEAPALKYDLSFYSSEEGEEFSIARRDQLKEINSAVFSVQANDVISTPHQTTDGAWRSSSFVFPFHDRRPIMLISAGTGIAPFRAFLQDLEHERDTSEHGRRLAYLFYGCRNPSTDFLYAEELLQARGNGVLDQLNVVFSGDSSKPKRYVQDALINESDLVARHLMQDEGYIFVCGSLAMGRAVKKAIAYALLKHPEYSEYAVATQQDAERVVTQRLTSTIVTELW
ncbi:hypothetical protein BBO99_00004097 [Phytophthora kernoviae]|uniref:NADPH--hemoprotein reductase n=1 Tax=Phytophthora kernoviae TaxID=325452 RepID=A0A421F1A2_9STRA|nr:hypothetical protein JM16_002881 [Phytophthora kernoviae]KAG2527983.1 hypothetical protein JM18_003440 [Phytophthora kernoviae]RLN14621.1 hypothetical protein BBI17_004199 [Phytophthora kernoviae]RLN81006.1 hypothetical protein BBO99_00004097 [Phytophthora kernoviae]